jgi:hypothetical protein
LVGLLFEICIVDASIYSMHAWGESLCGVVCCESNSNEFEFLCDLAFPGWVALLCGRLVG